MANNIFFNEDHIFKNPNEKFLSILTNFVKKYLITLILSKIRV